MAGSDMDSTTKVVLSIVIFFSGLIGIIAMYSLFKGTLNPEGTLTVMSGIVTGLMGGLFLRWKSKDDKNGGGNGS